MKNSFLCEFIADLERREGLHWKFVARFKSQLLGYKDYVTGKKKGKKQEDLSQVLMSKALDCPDVHPCEADLFFLFAYQLKLEEMQNKKMGEKEVINKNVVLAEALLTHAQQHAENENLSASELLFRQCSVICEGIPLKGVKKITETWGVSLLGLGHVTALVNNWETDDKRLNKVAWDKAEELFLALPFYNIWRPYNMACLSSLRKQDECKKWLEECYTHYYTQEDEMKNALLEDPDLDWIRAQEWFDEFMKKVHTRRSHPAFVEPI
eukprot:CAMPEP_0174256418 /NCGR_PEP_ID=MMETSP0439-20130205/5652_1 /TAXON_ID=0 /ORGANISM="Stereomyxa ramosa, Strain Chinc5" /LENGTH=266 /DNA_ID=CAMNT_0015339011 /DNA_START=253 /DNA_END=1053 /DNA_ORIENTATION=-